MATENKVKFGLKNVYYAKMLTNAANASPTYATPVAWPGAVNLSMDAEGELSPFRADNMDYYVPSANNGYSGSFESALIPESFKQDILGEIVAGNGIQVEDADVEPASFALLFQFEGDAHNTRHVFYNCKCTRPSVGSETTGETIEPVTETMDLTATKIFVAALNKYITKGKTNADTDAAVYDAWFEAVTLPTAASTPSTPSTPST